MPRPKYLFNVKFRYINGGTQEKECYLEADSPNEAITKVKTEFEEFDTTTTPPTITRRVEPTEIDFVSKVVDYKEAQSKIVVVK